VVLGKSDMVPACARW